MAAILWTIIVVIVVFSVAGTVVFYSYALKRDASAGFKVAKSQSDSAAKGEQMIGAGQFCSNCSYKNGGYCESPFLYRQYVNPVTGNKEKKSVVYNKRCDEIVGGEYCKWESKEENEYVF